MTLPDFMGALGSDEHTAWREQSAKLQARYRRKFLKRRRDLGIVGYDKPAPGEVDELGDEEG